MKLSILLAAFASVALSDTLSKRAYSDFRVPLGRNGYTLEKIQGSGSFGDVYRARRKLDGLVVAIKSAKDSDGNDQIHTEMTILENLKHPSIVQLLDSFNDDAKHTAGIVLELGGDSLQKVIEDAALTPQEKTAVFRDIVKGVQYMHSEEYCHLDLKPGNIVMSLVR